MPPLQKRPTARAALAGLLATRRLPTLFVLTATLLVVDILVPDVVPFADELLLGLATAILGSWRRKRGSAGTDGAS